VITIEAQAEDGGVPLRVRPPHDHLALCGRDTRCVNDEGTPLQRADITRTEELALRTVVGSSSWMPGPRRVTRQRPVKGTKQQTTTPELNLCLTVTRSCACVRIGVRLERRLLSAY
jgi:hypothetical protein